MSINVYLNLLRSVSLFANISEHDLASMLNCLRAEIENVKKSEIILLAGSRPEHVGIVLSGQLHVVKEDYDGNRTLIAAVTPGEIFAEALCCAGVTDSPVTVCAEQDSTVLLLRFDRILRTCPHSCVFHVRLIESMLELIARKNLMLQNRMDMISAHSVREKVLRYLKSFQAPKGQDFIIPFNREALANYLCVERSALSHELSRMKNDGLIEYRKNNFTLLK